MNQSRRFLKFERIKTGLFLKFEWIKTGLFIKFEWIKTGLFLKLEWIKTRPVTNSLLTVRRGKWMFTLFTQFENWRCKQLSAHSTWCIALRSQHKVAQINLQWGKSGEFFRSDFSTFWRPAPKCTKIWSEKFPGIFHIWDKSDPLLAKSATPGLLYL